MQTTEHRLDTATDWANAPLTSLIGHIVDKHHAYLKAALPRLTQLTVAAIAGDTGRREQLQGLQGIFLGLKEELESHLWKEEVVLFPLVSGLENARKSGASAPASHCGSVANPIRVMEFEHDNANGALAEMRRLASNYALPDAAPDPSRALFAGLAELEADLHQHIHLENDILFPRVIELEASVA